MWQWETQTRVTRMWSDITATLAQHGRASYLMHLDEAREIVKLVIAGDELGIQVMQRTNTPEPNTAALQVWVPSADRPRSIIISLPVVEARPTAPPRLVPMGAPAPSTIPLRERRPAPTHP